MLDAAQAQYLKLLKASPAAIRYLKQRGLTGEIAAHFGLGWSGTDRHGLSQVFPNYDDPALVEAGLVIESEDGRRYDRFRERVMFPIRNARGSLIGFGGRIIGKGEPKYLNSPETPLFSRGRNCTACGRPARRSGRKARSSWSRATWTWSAWRSKASPTRWRRWARRRRPTM